MALDTNLQNSVELLKRGPVQVVIDPDNSNVELFVEDGVDVNLIRGLEEAETDTLGVYDLFTSGDSAELELTLPESSSDVVNVLFPEGADGTTYRGFGRAAGLSMRGYAKAIRIRPWQSRSASTTQIDLWLCVPASDVSHAMSKSDNHKFTMTFKALPDPENHGDGILIGKLTFAARS